MPNQPRYHDISIYPRTVQSLIDVFCDGTIDDIHQKRKKIELWVRHN